MVLIWIVVVVLLAAWSGLVWTGQAVLTGMLSHVGSLGTDWVVPDAVTDWLPTPVANWLIGAVETLTPHLHALANGLPSLSTGVTVLAWGVWIVGAVLLLGMALVAQVSVALLRKSKASTAPVATLAGPQP